MPKNSVAPRKATKSRNHSTGVQRRSGGRALRVGPLRHKGARRARAR
ncbi:MAG TPA: hypothetical protein VN213_13590 [Solirubrobacteraceae bacterium]|nr:hypothetical protein [Solirubrobacteraceae bacterium]